MIEPIDLLQPITAFLLNGGVYTFIKEFREPSIEAISYHQARYNSVNDSLQLQYFGSYSDDFPYEWCQILYFKSAFKEKLHELKSVVITDLKKYIDKHRKNARNLKTFGEEYEGELNSIKEQIVKEHILDPYKEQIKEFFKELSIEAATLYNKVTVKEPQRLSFKMKCSTDILRRIYNLEVPEYSFFDKDQTSFTSFLTLLSSRDVYNEAKNHKIFFACQTREAAYLLQKMKQFFPNLSPKTIGNSERFYSNRGNLIRQNSLETALGKNKPAPKTQARIDIFFAKLTLEQEKE
jgi:hypothetical protein